MKKLILIALTVASAYQALADNTRLSIKPGWEANCLREDYPLLNEVSEIEKLKEDEDTATFQFVMRLISCQSFERIPVALNRELLQISLGSSKITTSMRSQNEVVVVATFNKVKIFKLDRSKPAPNRDTQVRKTNLIFHPFGYFVTPMTPYGYTPYAGYSFWWNVRLSLDHTQSMFVEIQKVSAQEQKPVPAPSATNSSDIVISPVKTASCTDGQRIKSIFVTKMPAVRKIQEDAKTITLEFDLSHYSCQDLAVKPLEFNELAFAEMRAAPSEDKKGLSHVEVTYASPSMITVQAVISKDVAFATSERARFGLALYPFGPLKSKHDFGGHHSTWIVDLTKGDVTQVHMFALTR